MATTANTVTLITDVKALNKEIALIGIAGKKLDTRIHVAACSCISQAEAHGNIDPALRLIKAMPKSSRTNALLEWFETYGKFTFDTDAKLLTYDKTKCTDMVGGMATPFWELKKEPAYKPFDLNDEIAKIVKKGIERQKAIVAASSPEEKELASMNAIDAVVLEQLKSLVVA